uniref:ATP synthase subunit a n=1 Tax=Cyrtopodion scabrum TaxID=303590 RepID=A0A1Y1CC32_CYRSA|nr:ATP synthase F0 subunit 6 [Cyrtopodion scabrum]BAX77915.1 ATPase subunit 6 [Cyrtopodion scabrum]
MTMNLFNQFMTPHMLGIPLILLALLMPPLLIQPKPRLTPNRTAMLQTWLMMMFTKQLMLPLNKPGHSWSLPLLMIMTYILLLNLLGLLPYTFTPTTQLSLNMGLAIPLWLATVLIGLRNQPSTSLAHMLPTGTPLLLIPILITIETISLIIRPLALGVRLTANLTAGHLLMTLISTAAMTLPPLSYTLAATTTVILIMLMTLEIAVAVIQAYVFTLLLSLYLQENT